MDWSAFVGSWDFVWEEMSVSVTNWEPSFGSRAGVTRIPFQGVLSYEQDRVLSVTLVVQPQRQCDWMAGSVMSTAIVCWWKMKQNHVCVEQSEASGITLVCSPLTLSSTCCTIVCPMWLMGAEGRCSEWRITKGSELCPMRQTGPLMLTRAMPKSFPQPLGSMSLQVPCCLFQPSQGLKLYVSPHQNLPNQLLKG